MRRCFREVSGIETDRGRFLEDTEVVTVPCLLDLPDELLLISKAPTTVTNPGSPIVHPENEQVDYEVELAVNIGRTAKNLEEDEVDDYIADYTVLNDVSGRDAQFSDGQFFRGKSYDPFRRQVRH